MCFLSRNSQTGIQIIFLSTCWLYREFLIPEQDNVNKQSCKPNVEMSLNFKELNGCYSGENTYSFSLIADQFSIHFFSQV